MYSGSDWVLSLCGKVDHLDAVVAIQRVIKWGKEGLCLMGQSRSFVTRCVAWHEWALSASWLQSQQVCGSPQLSLWWLNKTFLYVWKTNDRAVLKLSIGKVVWKKANTWLKFMLLYVLWILPPWGKLFHFWKWDRETQWSIAQVLIATEKLKCILVVGLVVIVFRSLFFFHSKSYCGLTM